MDDILPSTFGIVLPLVRRWRSAPPSTPPRQCQSQNSPTTSESEDDDVDVTAVQQHPPPIDIEAHDSSVHNLEDSAVHEKVDTTTDRDTKAEAVSLDDESQQHEHGRNAKLKPL